MNHSVYSSTASQWRRGWVRSVRISLLLLVAGFVPAVLVPAEAQESGQEPLLSPLVQREKVRFIQFDLMVEEKVGRKWRRARNLRREQIIVSLGGIPVELDGFETDCRWAKPAGGEPPVTLARDAGAPEPATGVALPSPIRYILYFDLEHLKLGGSRLALKGSLAWAEQVVSPTDEVMIVTGGSSLRIARPMRPAAANLPEDLRAALKHGRGSLGWAEAEVARSQEIWDIYRIYWSKWSNVGAIAAAEGLANTKVQQDFLRTRRSLSNLRQLLSMFDSIEGTKNLVFFGETVRQIPGGQYPFATDPLDVTPFLKQLSRAANERNVRIYPVAAGGGVADSAFTFLASETGGRVTERSNRLLDVFTRIGEDMSCFYQVGFHVVPRETGISRRITVKIRGEAKDYRVRHRRTVDDPTAEQRVVDAVRAAFLDPHRVRSFPVKVGAYRLAPALEGNRVRLEVAVDLKHLLGLPGADNRSRISVEVGTMVFRLLPEESDHEMDEGSAWVGVDTGWEPWQFARKATLTLPPRSDGEIVRMLVAVQEIRAPPGRLRIVAVVQDLQAGTLGAGMADFLVPEERPVLGKLRLMAEDPGSVLLGWQQEAEEGNGRKRILPLDPLLPEGALLREEKSVWQETAAFLVYSVCDPGVKTDAPGRESRADAPAAFAGWTLIGNFDCDVGHPGGMPTFPAIPRPEGGGSCTLIVEPLPSWVLSLPGDCRYEVTLQRPSGEQEVRDLSFQVRK